MDEPKPASRTRDADRTRQAILDAAESLFAGKGYDAASLQEIGTAAGYSRGTPGYFFGSKQLLYEAVLERAFADELAFVGERLTEAAAAGGGAEAELTAAIEGVLEFAAWRPNVLRLIEREALAAATTGEASAGLKPAMQAGLAMTADLLARGPFRPVAPEHVLLDILALCWFPAVHAETFVRGVGVDPGSATFAAERKRHIVELVLRGIRQEPGGSGPGEAADKHRD